MADTQTPTQEGSAAGLYNKLEPLRRPYLERAWECAELTLPALLPREGHSATTDLPTPFQGIGARGVNNLASKLLLTLFPPNVPCFRYEIDDFTLEALTKREGMRAQVEEGLNKIVRAVQSDFESSAIRVSAFEALKHLIVTGNDLLYVPKEGGMRVFSLDRYVIRRDPTGNVLDIVVKECIAPDALPESIVASLPAADPTQDPHKPLDLFTHIKRTGSRVTVYQEIKGVRVGESGWYPLDKCPWIPLRWTKIDGESYGRGYIEEYLGDLKSDEGLTQAIVEGSAMAAKVLFLNNPNGTTDTKKVSRAENGAVIDGVATDITVLQMQKFNDFRIAFETINKIEDRLSKAFLLNSSVQRSGERVTAEEIRYMAGELEDALGGIYSILSLEMQLPLVQYLIHRLQKRKRLPTLPADTAKPVVVTGLEAMGKNHEVQKLRMFLQDYANLMGPESIARDMNTEELGKRLGNGHGIDMKGLVKTREEKAAEAAQAQQAAMMQSVVDKGTGPMINAASAAAQANGPQA